MGSAKAQTHRTSHHTHTRDYLLIQFRSCEGGSESRVSYVRDDILVYAAAMKSEVIVGHIRPEQCPQFTFLIGWYITWQKKAIHRIE